MITMNTKTRTALEAIEILRNGVDDPELQSEFKAQIDDALACASDDERLKLQAALAGEATQSGEAQAPKTTQARWLPPMDKQQAAAFAARMNSKDAREERQRKLANLRSNPGMRAMRNVVIGCPVDLMERLLPVKE